MARIFLGHAFFILRGKLEGVLCQNRVKIQSAEGVGVDFSRKLGPSWREMTLKVQPMQELGTAIEVPGDRSCSHRAAIFGGGSGEGFPDGMEITGGNPLGGAEIESYGNHRTAMAFVMAGLFLSDGEVLIPNAAWIATSYLGFVESLETMSRGGVVSI